MNPYFLLTKLFPQRLQPTDPKRIVLVLPCCIGDVVLATATLAALRRAHPNAHITWAVGGWSKGVIEHHPMLDAIVDTGKAALPVKTFNGMREFVQQMRAGRFDLMVSLVRSPFMSVAALLSGIPHRAGLDSAGRGFGYTIRAPIDPLQPRHEADVYLDVARALGIDVRGCWANVPVQPDDAATIDRLLADEQIGERFIVLHPGGGQNPGMVMDSKRWPPDHFAALAGRLTKTLGAHIVLISGPNDGEIVNSVRRSLGQLPHNTLIGKLSFGQIGALAARAVIYIGNDTGMTHLAAASGGRTAMILGPSDPVRYAPFTPNAVALWRPTTAIGRGGVTDGAPSNWDWERDGISVEESERKIQEFLGHT